MFSYSRSKNGFGYFYCKRQVCNDEIHTNSLKLVLSPWNIDKYTFVDENHVFFNKYPCLLSKDGKSSFSAEQLFLYEKARYHKLDVLQNQIVSCDECELTNLDKDIKITTEWYDKRIEIMQNVLKCKFEQCKQFRKELQGKDSIFICEKNERFWSCGLPKSLTTVTKSTQFPGQNQLDKLLENMNTQSNI